MPTPSPLPDDVIRKIAEEQNVPPALLFAVWERESSRGRNASAYTPNEHGIYGQFQIKKGTFYGEMGKGADYEDEYQKAVAAAKYLRKGLDKYNNDPELAYKFYHGGPNEKNWGPVTEASAKKVARSVAAAQTGPVGAIQQAVERFTPNVPIPAGPVPSPFEFGAMLGIGTAQASPLETYKDISRNMPENIKDAAKSGATIIETTQGMAATDITPQVGAAMEAYKAGAQALPKAIADIFSGSSTSSTSAEGLSPLISPEEITSAIIPPADMAVQGIASPTAATAVREMQEAAQVETAQKAQQPEPPTKQAEDLTKTQGYEDMLLKIGQKMEQVAAEIQATKAATIRYNQDYTDAATEKMDAIKSVAGGKALGFSALAAAEQRQYDGAMNTINLLGLDNEKMNNLQADLALRIAGGTQQLLPLRSALTEKANAIPAFTDNPIGWIFGNMDLQKDIAVHNNLQGEVNALKQKQEALTSFGRSVLDINAAKTAEGRARIAEANAETVAREAAQSVLDVRMQIAQHSQAAQIANLQRSQTELSLMEQHVRLLSTVEGAAAKREAKEVTAAANATDLLNKNKALNMLGYTEVPSIERFDKLPKRTKDDVQIILDSGGMKLGRDEREAFEVASRGDPRKMPAGQRAMLEIETHINRDLVGTLANYTSPDGTPFSRLKNDEQRVIWNQKMREEFAKMEKNLTYYPIPDKQSNPYAAPSIETMLQNPTFGKTRLAEAVRQAKATSPSWEITPSEVVALAKQGLKSGAIYEGPGKIEAAAGDVTTYFQEVVKHNNEAVMFERWNIPEQRRYMLGGIDMTKNANVTVEMAKALAFPGEAFFKKHILPILPPLITPGAALTTARNDLVNFGPPIAKALGIQTFESELEEGKKKADKSLGVAK